MVGLHCCGDLAPAVLNYFVNSSLATSVHSVVLFGCCYHKMSSSCTFPLRCTNCYVLLWLLHVAGYDSCNITKLGKKRFSHLVEPVLKYVPNKGHNTFNLSMKGKFCGPYRTMAMQFYLLKKTTSV